MTIVLIESSAEFKHLKLAGAVVINLINSFRKPFRD